MNKKIAIILSHCNTGEKKEVLIDTISKLKKVENLDILLTSHIILPESIVNQCDYFVYDKSNPILKWPVKSYSFWSEHSHKGKSVRLIYFADDYIWTVFNQILMGYNSISHKTYEEYIFLNYDLVIDSRIMDQIKENTGSNKFYDSEDLNGSRWFPSWIFYILNKESVDLFINSISFDVYLEKGENLFNNFLLGLIDYQKGDLVTRERIVFSDETSGKKFNNSSSPSYSFFWGYDNSDQIGQKNYFFYDLSEQITIRCDNQKYFTINQNDTFLARVDFRIEILENGSFVDLEHNNYNRIQIIETYD